MYLNVSKYKLGCVDIHVKFNFYLIDKNFYIGVSMLFVDISVYRSDPLDEDPLPLDPLARFE